MSTGEFVKISTSIEAKISIGDFSSLTYTHYEERLVDVEGVDQSKQVKSEEQALNVTMRQVMRKRMPEWLKIVQEAKDDLL